jgi:hypothetical protein
MKLTKPIILLTVSFLFILTKGSSQQSCETSSNILTAYYTYAPNFKSGVGFEAGKLNGESPLGYFAGCSFQLFKDKVSKTDSTKSTDMLADFYVKASYRLTRVDNFVSIFVVASPRYSLQGGFDLHQGLRFIFPFSERVAMGIEPMYAVRQNNFLVNFQLSFCVR